MRKCWSEVPAERPSFESLEEQFGSLISSQDQQMAERAIAQERSVYAQVRRDLGPPQGYTQLRRDTRSQAPAAGYAQVNKRAYHGLSQMSHNDNGLSD